MASSQASSSKKNKPAPKNFSPIKTAMILDCYSPVSPSALQITKISCIPSESQPIRQPQKINYDLSLSKNASGDIQGWYKKYCQYDSKPSEERPLSLQDQVQASSQLANKGASQLIKRPTRRHRQPQQQREGEQKIYFSQPRVEPPRITPQGTNSSTILIQKHNIQKRQQTTRPMNQQHSLRKGKEPREERYQSEEPKRNQQYFTREPKVQDTQLLSFQVEIERRFANAVTKNYMFPRMESPSENQEDYFLLGRQEEFPSEELTPSADLRTKYKGSQMSKYKERFCEKIKAKPVLQQSMSTKQLLVKSIQQLEQERQQSEQQFFHHTRKRVQQPKPLDLKSPTYTGPQFQNIISSGAATVTAGSLVLGQSIVNSNLKNSRIQIPQHNYGAQIQHSESQKYFSQSSKSYQKQEALQNAYLNGNLQRNTQLESILSKLNNPSSKNIVKQQQQAKKKRVVTKSMNSSATSSQPHSPNHNASQPGHKSSVKFIETTPLKSKQAQQIASSYKSFKKLEDILNKSGRKPSSSTTNRSGSSQKSANRSASKEGIQPAYKDRRKLKQVMSTLQLTGSQSLKKSYEITKNVRPLLLASDSVGHLLNAHQRIPVQTRINEKKKKGGEGQAHTGGSGNFTSDYS